MKIKQTSVIASSETNTVLANVKKLSAYTRILSVIILLFIAASIYLFSITAFDNSVPSQSKPLSVSQIKTAPIPDGKEGEMVRYGKELITNTANYFGPEVIDGATMGNNLACSNCHLDAGTKPYAAPYIGLTGVFPQYIGRENKITSLEERINGCFERSMNGHAIPVDSREMRAMISYIKHLSKHTPVGQRLEGQGFVQIQVPPREANVHAGAAIFKKHCATCHGEQGAGIPKGDQSDNKGYLYPPLWGSDSFNDGAGMARLLTAARFIKGNMPLGATAENPTLTDEEAYDVAAYINSFPRPEKRFKERDYPDLSKKPKDCAYPPFADNLSAQQHKIGPFNF